MTLHFKKNFNGEGDYYRYLPQLPIYYTVLTVKLHILIFNFETPDQKNKNLRIILIANLFSFLSEYLESFSILYIMIV